MISAPIQNCSQSTSNSISQGSVLPTHSAHVKSDAVKDNFEALTQDLSAILGPSSGLTSKDVDVAHLQRLMQDYVSRDREWSKYAFLDASRGYTRNLVDEGNGKSNLLILVWTPGKGSPIHDHANAHCLMKVLAGSLVETRFTYPSPEDHISSTSNKEQNSLRIIKQTTYHRDQVAYMSDELGLHRISNPSTSGEVAVSLHLYTPPNAAREGCNIFDETTGRSSHVTQSNFYSRFGERLWP